ncbi:MAG: hypothetical protein HY518_03165 [Candidatus Aenigmarchaeota archaeon]|nr:hypothetical protein [Candidatus Aenigmarchaeota archaeon]
MSKFYTYEELRERFPTREAVTQARDAVASFLEDQTVSLVTTQLWDYEDPKNPIAVVYGSTTWGLHPDIGEQHTRRSDVDVALRCKGSMGYNPLSYNIEEFCNLLSLQTNVPIEITMVGNIGLYQSLINPSTADHFRLLERFFPNGPYGKFRRLMKVDFQDRVDDFNDYFRQMSSYRHLPFVDSRWIERSETMKILSKLENFPDHIIRKALGREKMLPAPDTKAKIRDVFFGFPYEWQLRTEFGTTFSSMFTISSEYEDMIDDVSKGLSGRAYHEKLRKSGFNLMELARSIYSKVGLNIRPLLRIVRIPKGTPVIILHHYPGSGSADVTRLEDDFGNPKDGVSVKRGYDKFATDFVTIDKGLEFVKTDIPISQTAQYDRDITRIEDPIDPVNGWFTYKPKRRGYCSIKACDEKTLTEFEDECKTGDEWKVSQKYYRLYASDALNTKHTRVPKRLLEVSPSS